MDMQLIVLYMTVALGISEALALIPQLKSNSLLQLAINIVRAIVGSIKK